MVLVFFRGGMFISQTQETAQASDFLCPNASCHRVFKHPLKTVNVGVSAEPFDACPFCLTEILPNSVPALVSPPQEERMVKSDVQKQVDTLSTSAECKKQFGYLSQRAAKDQIPDECLTCKVIVQCMLKIQKEHVDS